MSKDDRRTEQRKMFFKEYSVNKTKQMASKQVVSLAGEGKVINLEDMHFSRKATFTVS